MKTLPGIRESLQLARYWLGLRGIVGLALICGTLGADQYLGRKAAAEAENLRQQRIALRHGLKAPAAPPAETPAAVIGQMRDALPTRSELSLVLGQLSAKAAAHNLAVGQVQQTEVAESALGIERVQVLYPVTGSYGAARAWLDDVLTGLPAVAVEAINIRRADTREANVATTFKLVVHMRRDA